jgi:putative hemolysin
MSPLLVAEIAALLVLLGLSAFFSSAETALFSLSPMQTHRIRRTHPKAARNIEALLAAPTDLLSSILIGNTIVNVAAADIGYVIAETLIPAYAEMVAIPVMTIVLIMFGEVTPKRLAVRRPEDLASRYVVPLTHLIWLCTPLRALLSRITRSFHEQLTPRHTALNEQELLTAVDVSHEEGVLNKEERMMVDGIIRLETLHARDVMTPRVDLIGVDLNTDPARYVEVCRRARFRYLPVYRGDLDHVEGFLDVATFLLTPEHDIKTAMYPHFYVPDTAPLDTLLTTFQQQKRRLAIVIDEYGGTAGLITRGDILDEIAEFAIELRGEQKLNVEPNGPNRWLVNGTANLEEINYDLDLTLEAAGADRIAGWITAHAGRIPRTGDVIEAQGCRVTVLQMRKHRITLAQVEKPARSDESEEVFL